MIRYGLYTRVSADGLEELEEESLDTQMDRLQRYVESKNTTGDEDFWVVARYREEGDLSDDIPRPEFERMLSDAQAGELDILLCTDETRMARSLRDLQPLVDTLGHHHVVLMTVGEQVDATNPMDRFVVKMFMSAAALRRGLRSAQAPAVRHQAQG